MSMLEKLYEKYQPRQFYQGGPNDIEESANPTDLPVIPQARLNMREPMQQPAQDVQDLTQKYDSIDNNPMMQDYIAARKKAREENELLRQSLEKHLTGEPVDKSEMWFKLAAALASPTRVQGISEPMARVAQVLGEQKAEERAQRQANQLTALKARQTMAQLSGEEAKDIGELAAKYAKGNLPLSSAGKAAFDAGLKPGTPEYAAFVKNIASQAEQGSGPAWANVAINQQRLQNDIERQRLVQSKDEKKDISLASKDMQSLENAAQKLADLKTASTNLSEHKGLGGISGMTGYVPSLAGSEAAQAENAKANLDAKLQALGKEVSSMSGSIGAMATQEWTMLQQQIAAIDPRKLGEEGTKRALKDLNDYADRTFLRLKSQYEREHQPIIETSPERLSPRLNYKTEDQIKQEKESELERLRQKHQDKD